MTYNPWDDAARRYPHVHIEWHSIRPYSALWFPTEDVILVDDSIDQVERRFALAHEIGHMDVGDHSTKACWFENRQESAADRLAARRLIDVHELAAVMRWCTDPREIAAEMQVPVRVLRVRTRWMSPPERGVVWRATSRREAVA